MAKQISKTVVETRNGYDVELVEGEMEMATGGSARFFSYRVLTSSKPRRIIEDYLYDVAAAQAVADAQPKIG